MVAEALRHVLSREHAERLIATLNQHDGDASVFMDGG